ncbi:hypothetical protein KAR91_19305, partial [Candidatus Pacearchaeota archaeon]|nr:hypothetical protein [Candidatus Pacearchaeota archaeon]
GINTQENKREERHDSLWETQFIAKPNIADDHVYTFHRQLLDHSFSKMQSTPVGMSGDHRHFMAGLDPSPCEFVRSYSACTARDRKILMNIEYVHMSSVP